MALNQIWISANGTDTASGVTYALAKKTLAGGIGTWTAAATNTYNILNIVNDGTHAMLTSGELLLGGRMEYGDGFRGTTYSGTDYGFIIQGVTENGTPAMATLAATATRLSGLCQLYGSITNSQALNYGTIKGLVFDYTALIADTSTLYAIAQFRTGCCPLRIQDCEIIGSTYGATTPEGARALIGDGTLSYTHVTVDGFDTSYNVFVNASLAAHHNDGVYQPRYVHRNVFVWSTDNSTANVVGFLTGSAVPGTYHDYNVTHNTLYVASEYTGDTIATQFNVAATNGTNISINSNLLHMQPAADAVYTAPFTGGLFAGGTGNNGTTGTMGYNYFALGTQVSQLASWTSGGFYDVSFQHPDWPSVTSGTFTTTFATDVVVTNVGLGDTFNETTSAWTWSDPSGNGYDHNMPFDLRPLVGRTTAYGGGIVGAVADGVSPVANDDTYSTTAGQSIVTTATDGVLANDTPAIPGATLTASLVSNVATGTLSLSSDGGFTYQVPITYSGTQTFTYKALETGTPGSNTASVSITVSEAPLPPPTPGGDIKYDAVVDSLPFYRPVFKADLQTMVRVQENETFAHIDMRHYLKDSRFDESTHRIVEVAPSARYVGSLGGVDESTGFMLETDTTVNVSVVWHNGTTNVTFGATVSDLLVFDQAGIRSFMVNNTSSATATVMAVAFQ